MEDLNLSSIYEAKFNWGWLELLYRFQIELSDVDRGIYKTLDFRVAQHPSETLTYLLTRVLAFALSYQDNLEFSASGLGDPESPALQIKGPQENIELWLEIGNPAAKKLHKACKLAKFVAVFTYKSAQVLIEDIQKNKVHRANEIQIFYIDPKFLLILENLVQKNNRWSVLHQDGHIDVTSESGSANTEIKKFFAV